jgi:uncharacterized membrane protein YadS
VLGGDLIAAAVTTVILLVHGRWFVNGKKEWLLIAAVTCLGTAVDSLWVYSAILTFPEAITYTPVWLACIWVVFATSLCHSLQWLQQRLLLACVLGAIAGPSSYLGGAALAGVEIAEPRLLSFAVIALAWAIIMPIILMLARRVSDD